MYIGFPLHVRKIKDGLDSLTKYQTDIVLQGASTHFHRNNMDRPPRCKGGIYVLQTSLI